MIKSNKHNLLVTLNFMVLIALVAIQFVWIYRAANLEKRSFKHKVEMALIDVRKDIGSSIRSCQYMCNFLNGRQCPSKIKQLKVDEINQYIQKNLKIHNINLDYYFGIMDNDSLKSSTDSTFKKTYEYIQSLNGVLEKDGIQIAIRFPDRNKFIFAEIGGMFITSLFLILFVMISLVLIMRYYKNEKKLISYTHEFINNMTHEFQTPLANIGFANNLIKKNDRIKETKKLNDYTNIISEEKEKLQKHVESILNIACKENCTFSDMEVISIHSILNELSKNYNKLISEKNGKIKFDLNAGESDVYANEHMLLHAFSNILDNAQKYSFNNIDINIETKNVDKSIIIKISDKGIGISKKHLNNIFDKYYRVPTGDIHNIKGFGMGLTFVKRIINTHKGKINVTSSLGKGTCFFITLPLSTK